MKKGKHVKKPPQNISLEEWPDLLDEHPEWADACPWDKLLQISDWGWEWILGHHPEFWKRCPAWLRRDFKPGNWAGILAGTPSLARHCDFADFDGNAWVKLLSAQPRFAGKCDFARFDAWHWADLLSVRPEFADRCDFSKLDAVAWELLLLFQPQFADKCDWTALPRDTQAAILARHPELLGHCTIRNMSLGRLDDIAGKWARKSRGLELGLLALPGGGPEPELPVKRFLAWGRRNGLAGAALRDYAEWMRGPDAPESLRRHAGAAKPQVKNTLFAVGIEGNRWRGDPCCEVDCPDAPSDWNEDAEDIWSGWKTVHETHPLRAGRTSPRERWTEGGGRCFRFLPCRGVPALGPAPRPRPPDAPLGPPGAPGGAFRGEKVQPRRSS